MIHHREEAYAERNMHFLRPLRHRGEDFISCRPWLSPIASMPGAGALRCYRILDAGEGIWPEELTKAILTDTEQQIWQDLGRHGGRRRQWLLGRFAAKCAVCSLVKEQELEVRDVEILPDWNGRPCVDNGLTERLGYCLAISIAHSGRDVVGIAGIGNRFHNIGVDIEPIGRKSADLERIFLHKDEQDLVSNAFPGRTRQGVLRFWCVKEATAKALGAEIVGGPLNLAVEDLDLETGRAFVALRGQLAAKLPFYKNRHLSAYSGCGEGLVFAASVIE